MAAGEMIWITTKNHKMRVNLLSKRTACVQSLQPYLVAVSNPAHKTDDRWGVARVGAAVS
jgi:hypothetical protein